MAKFTRRDFLKMAGVGTAAAALYELGPKVPLLR
ncbi:MAG: twin-arginine translocation signal domain-containing protein, partial [Anaerolineae bacterium]|nr:twin-arginine translocation signal domain-containing protein [Anaerolineae bacterium]